MPNELAPQDDGDDPPAKPNAANGSEKLQTRGIDALGARRHERIAGGRHQHEHRNERGEQQELVSQWVEQSSQIGDQIPGACKHAVVVVGQRRDHVENEGDAARAGRADEWKCCYEGRGENPAGGDRVGKIHRPLRR